MRQNFHQQKIFKSSAQKWTEDVAIGLFWGFSSVLVLFVVFGLIFWGGYVLYGKYQSSHTNPKARNTVLFAAGRAHDYLEKQGTLKGFSIQDIRTKDKTIMPNGEAVKSSRPGKDADAKAIYLFGINDRGFVDPIEQIGLQSGVALCSAGQSKGYCMTLSYSNGRLQTRYGQENGSKDLQSLAGETLKTGSFSSASWQS